MTTPSAPPQIWGLPRWAAPILTVLGTTFFTIGALLRLRKDPDTISWVVVALAVALAAWVVLLLVRMRTRGWPVPVSSGLLTCGLGLNIVAGALDQVSGTAWGIVFALAISLIIASIVATRAESRARAAAGAER